MGVLLEARCVCAQNSTSNDPETVPPLLAPGSRALPSTTLPNLILLLSRYCAANDSAGGTSWTRRRSFRWRCRLQSRCRRGRESVEMKVMQSRFAGLHSRLLEMEKSA